MPFVYVTASAKVLENYLTSATPNTPIDAAFWKPGASRPLNIQSLRVQGKGAGLTALSGIALRLEKYPTTGAAGGTAVTPSPSDDRAPACVATAAYAATAAGAVTAGTGTLVHVGGCGCGASGPGGWVAATPDSNVVVDGGATKSVDLFSSSGTASLNYESWTEIVE